jgi:hypothetical protein
MDYGEAKKRVRRIASAPGHPQAKKNLINSIINQATVREGERAKSLLTQESLSFTGSGCRQCGYGAGRRLGDGRWRYENGKWKQL